MLRALVTLIASSLVVLVLGSFALVAGLVYPARWVIAFVSLQWARTIIFCAGVDLTVLGAHRLAPGKSYFFIGNHESGLDIPILVHACRGHVRFMAKDSLFRIPVFGWLMTRYQFVAVDRSRPRATLRNLDRVLGKMRNNPVSLAVFPEGTRSRDGKLLPFRRGAIKIGQRSGLDIVPFCIDGSAAVNHPDVFRAVPGPVRLEFMTPIPAADVALMSPGELHDRVREAVERGLEGGPASLRSEMPATVALERT